MRWDEFRCQPCSHKWYQHRDPDPRIRQLGVAMMVSGGITLMLGILEVIGRHA